ncbi:MAG TPA: HD domain-containing protein [Candidatus Paceibacterota bacterium]|jgi:uncharacterized protein
MTVPTFEEIERLHRKYAPSVEAFDLVFTHCRAVNEIAQQLLSSCSLRINQELVEAGCLLHDIGVYELSAEELSGPSYTKHGVLGEGLLRAERLPDELCRIASHHTGVGLTRDDVVRQKLPLPLQDYLAETDEELLVMYADKFHSKSTPPRFNRPESYSTFVSRYGDDKVVRFKQMQVKFGKPDLDSIARKYDQPLL